jgi:hypothetical protein
MRIKLFIQKAATNGGVTTIIETKGNYLYVVVSGGFVLMGLSFLRFGSN